MANYPEPGNIYDSVRAAQAQRNYNDMGETRVAARDNRYPDPGIIETLYNTLANIFGSGNANADALRQQNPYGYPNPINAARVTGDPNQFNDDYGDPIYSKGFQGKRIEPMIMELPDSQYYPQDDLSPNTFFLPRR